MGFCLQWVLPSPLHILVSWFIATDLCASQEPSLDPLEGTPGHTVACHHLEEAERL